MSSAGSILDCRVTQILAIRERSPLPLEQLGEALPEAASVRGLSSKALFPMARDAVASHAGLLLLLRCWDESHHISQNLSSVEGSYWHALAHRIEPDLGNANYWFRKVGRHPVFEPLHAFARTILEEDPVPGWTLKETWDPALFGSWCEDARTAQRSHKERTAIRIQQEEWNLLFFWCAGR
jgi:hypothetical protein